MINGPGILDSEFSSHPSSMSVHMDLFNEEFTILRTDPFSLFRPFFTFSDPRTVTVVESAGVVSAVTENGMSSMNSPPQFAYSIAPFSAARVATSVAEEPAFPGHLMPANCNPALIVRACHAAIGCSMPVPTNCEPPVPFRKSPVTAPFSEARKIGVPGGIMASGLS